jgi:hypothetical protein
MPITDRRKLASAQRIEKCWQADEIEKNLFLECKPAMRGNTLKPTGVDVGISTIR